jgi:hypothetical protein
MKPRIGCPNIAMSSKPYLLVILDEISPGVLKLPTRPRPGGILLPTWRIRKYCIQKIQNPFVHWVFFFFFDRIGVPGDKPPTCLSFNGNLDAEDNLLVINCDPNNKNQLFSFIPIQNWVYGSTVQM